MCFIEWWEQNVPVDDYIDLNMDIFMNRQSVMKLLSGLLA